MWQESVKEGCLRHWYFDGGNQEISIEKREDLVYVILIKNGNGSKNLIAREFIGAVQKAHALMEKFITNPESWLK